jgi:hypothetical protein
VEVTISKPVPVFGDKFYRCPLLSRRTGPALPLLTFIHSTSGNESSRNFVLRRHTLLVTLSSLERIRVRCEKGKPVVRRGRKATGLPFEGGSRAAEQQKGLHTKKSLWGKEEEDASSMLWATLSTTRHHGRRWCARSRR